MDAQCENNLNTQKYTPLQNTILFYEGLQTVDELCKNGADVNKLSAYGVSSLQYTIVNTRSVENAEILLKYGANVNIKYSYADNLLNYLFKYYNLYADSFKFAKLLLEYDANQISAISYPKEVVSIINNIVLLNLRN